MELEVYSGSDLLESMTLGPEEVAYLVYDYGIQILPNSEEQFGPGKTVHKIYGAEVQNSTEPGAKYEMNCPIKIETSYKSSVSHDDWETYKTDIDNGVKKGSFGISFDPKSENNYAEMIKEYEESGDEVLFENILISCIENDDAQVDLTEMSVELTDEDIGEGPLYLAIE